MSEWRGRGVLRMGYFVPGQAPKPKSMLAWGFLGGLARISEQQMIQSLWLNQICHTLWTRSGYMLEIPCTRCWHALAILSYYMFDGVPICVEFVWEHCLDPVCLGLGENLRWFPRPFLFRFPKVHSREFRLQSDMCVCVSAVLKTIVKMMPKWHPYWARMPAQMLQMLKNWWNNEKRESFRKEKYKDHENDNKYMPSKAWC